MKEMLSTSFSGYESSTALTTATVIFTLIERHKAFNARETGEGATNLVLSVVKLQYNWLKNIEYLICMASNCNTVFILRNMIDFFLFCYKNKL